MTNNFLNINADIIQQRWPTLYEVLANHQSTAMDVTVKGETFLINGIQLTSCIDRKAEAIIQTQHITSQRNVTVYGIGLGDCIIELINNSQVACIHVVILNIDVLMLSLSFIDQRNWLKSKKVSLQLWHRKHAVEKPFCALPAELELCDDDAKTLKDRIEQELNTNFINKQFSDAENLTINANRCKQSPSINTLPKPNTKQIFITAAGPTLESHIEYLQNNDCFIIALDASVKTLLSHNIKPSIVVSIDKISYQLFTDIPAQTFIDIPLVFFPNVDPKLLPYWPSSSYCAYSKTPMYKNYLPVKDKVSLFSAGSVIHPAVDLAVYLNAQDIILLGADFSFTRNKSHAQTKSGEFSTQLPHHIARNWVFNSMKEKVPTTTNFISYLRDLETFIVNNPSVNFINGSEEGAKIAGTTLWKK